MSIEKINSKYLKIAIYLLLVIISLSLFSISIIKHFPDIPDHNTMAYEAFHGRQILQVHFLYFVILMLPQLISSNINAVHVFSIIILTLSIVYKYKVSQKLIRYDLNKAEDLSEVENKMVDLISIVLPFALMVIQNLIYRPSATMFLGFLPLNIWHNSTTIFLMPFALLLFYYSYEYLIAFDQKKIWLILLLVIINLLIKPSFFMSFIVVFPLFSFLRYRFSEMFYYTFFVSFIGGLVLLAESRIGAYIGTTLISLKLAPFNVWSHWSENISLSFLCSVLFPLTYLLFYFKTVKNNLLLKYSYALFVVALLTFIFLSESGLREFDGNFLWEVIICNYIMFLTTAIALAKEILRKPKITFSMKDKVLVIIFLMHIFTGLIYIFKSPIWGFR